MKDQDSDGNCDKISRRDFLKATLAGSSALSAPTIINYLGQSPPSSDKEFLEIRDGNFYLGGEEYFAKGFNYYPKNHPWRVFAHWNPREIKKELEMGSKLGVNCLRTFINWNATAGKNAESYFDNVNRFLDIAENKGYKVLLTLFDMPTAEVYKNLQSSKSYLEDVIPRFNKDSRIMGWDIKNEPSLDYKYYGKEKVNAFLEEMINKVKELDDVHPVTVGGVSPVKFDNFVDQYNPRIVDKVDFVSIHYMKTPTNLLDTLTRIQKQTNKPVVLEEFGTHSFAARPEWPQDEDFQETWYRKALEAIKLAGISGSLFWTLLDFPVGKVPWKSKESLENHMGVFRTDYSKKPAAHVVEQYYKWTM